MLPQNNFNTKRSQKGAKFTHKIHNIAILIRHFTRVLWRTDVHNDALHKTVWIIWIDSENKFTPLFTRHTQLCNYKIEVLSKR